MLKMGTAVIECLAVGCPEGEYLELVGIVLDIGDLVFRYIGGME